MKIAIIVVSLFLIVSIPARSQGLPPSSVRQVFSLQRGDSLEYHIWNVGACSPQCSYYFLKLVDSVSYSVTQDTLSIFFQTQMLHFDSSGVPVMGASCGQCHTYFMYGDLYPVTSDQWIIPYLDSSIIIFLDSAYHIVSSQTVLVHDSVYRDNATFNGVKQNLFSSIVGGFEGTTEVYADSLGIVYEGEDLELSSNNREQLIYYHKASGSIWGTPFITTGISHIDDTYHIAIYPNPAQDRFVIQSGQYQGLHIDICDVLSKKILSLNLNSKETAVKRNNLPSGIYYWQVSDGITLIKSGKLILE